MCDKLKVGTRGGYPCLAGVVKKQPFARGSKSEHDAIVLEVDKGYGDYTFKLRMEGGNPFHDPTFDPFIGKRVMVEGSRHDYTFIVRCIEEL
jgi:hypothetical protein